ncbi:inositol monophosphatase family protein [Dactylosporangium sp. CA-139066]|uniref:inositol monophosphatase family protein n=1 Tax=Dactylosporangium sp. CA-139066 TaxID=3239930 RepID=UPI003D8BF058
MDLLTEVVRAAREAGARLLPLYSADARPASRAGIERSAHELQTAALEGLDGLRETLNRLRPAARWVGDAEERIALPDGEWWAVDEVEGAVNLLHGRPEWGVSIALVRDGAPVLAVFHEPVADRTHTAARGEGAYLGGEPLHVSRKPDLALAVVETSQVGDEPAPLRSRIGTAIGALMSTALLVRTTIPTTFPLLSVAAGRSDVFWQYAPALTGVAAGVLLATEAGGVAVDLTGAPWRPGAADLLVTTPALRDAARSALAAVPTPAGH